MWFAPISHAWKHSEGSIWAINNLATHKGSIFHYAKCNYAFVYFSREKQTNAHCTEGALMTLQLYQNIMVVRKCMGLMTSQLCTFRARSMLWVFVVPKLILLFTKEGWSAQPYLINFLVSSNLTQANLNKRPSLVISSKKIILERRPEPWYDSSSLGSALRRLAADEWRTGCSGTWRSSSSRGTPAEKRSMKKRWMKSDDGNFNKIMF